ncbi:MAG: hypothetical protein ABR950_01205 [Candidatus Dormibacteria bacterium]
MDLASRRIVQEYKDKRIPELTAKVKGYCPEASIEFVFDWDTFDGVPAALENLWSIYELPSYAVESVCKDALGREAVAATLHKIVVKNVTSDDQIKVEMAGDTLTVWMRCTEGQPGQSAGAGAGVSAIERVLMANL